MRVPNEKAFVAQCAHNPFTKFKNNFKLFSRRHLHAINSFIETVFPNPYATFQSRNRTYL